MGGLDGPRFGRYVVSGKVGEGSLGAVYRARHEELDRDAALKVLRAEVRGNEAAVAGMVAEASTLARLDHPNIVALYDFVQEPERTWLAEQWVDGAPLDAIVDEHGRLTPEQALGVMAGALAGLAHAHDNGVVHRDVAASNVVADMAGTSMLVDFGLASPVPDESGSGSAGLVGTPAYLSPEAARGEPVGKPGDVYSAAALTFHLLSGSPVFTGSAWEMVAAHRDRVAPELKDHGPRLGRLLERSLAKDPSVRPPDAGAFLAELEESARERYGAAWRTRASIAGLVASAVGTGAATGGGSAGGAAPAVGVEGLSHTVTGGTHAVVTTGRRVGTKTVIAAAVAAAVLVAGAAAGISMVGNDDDDPGGGRGASAPSPDGPGREPGTPASSLEGPGDDDGADGGAVSTEASLASGITFEGPAKFNFPGGFRASITVTCQPTCSASLESSQGDSISASWLGAAVGHTYDGAGPRWTFQGTPITSCGQLDPDSRAAPGLWSASMRVTENRLVLDAVQEEFRGDLDGGYCLQPRAALHFEGTPAK